MPLRRKGFILAAALALWCHGAAGVAVGQTSVQVRIGWDGWIHPGRWNPAFVTLADAKPRNVSLEIHTPYDRYHALRVGQGMTIGPQPQTFPLYLPLWNMNTEDVAVVVRDAVSGKKLANFPSDTARLTDSRMGDVTSHFVGISGRRATLRSLTERLPGAKIQAGYLDPAELPADAIGYDCLDVLVLNAPNLALMAVEQQQAIVDWVRTGGCLIFWPSEDPVPMAGPLLDILPCRIGLSGVVERTPEELKKVGLPPRFGKLRARELTPGEARGEGARAVPLLGTDDITAYRGRAGFGTVLVSPIDLTALAFDDAQHTWKFWRGILDGMILHLPADATKQSDRYEPFTETTLREQAAVREVGDLLGNVPGAGKFGFGYVAAVMIGMMVIVGPVDWFVLKRLGRQPWTWVTTGGWIGLVTLSAVYAGHLFKSGELYFRTFQLVEQIDGEMVARTDVAALYSPRTAEYDVSTPAESWWEPVSPGDQNYYAGYGGAAVAFHQTYRGNQPEPMVVNVWNLRFLRAESVAKGPPVLDASFSVVSHGDAVKKLVGTVTNLGPTPVKNLAVRTKDGLCIFAERAPGANRIEPGHSAKVDAVIDPEVRPTGAIDPTDPRLRGYYRYGQYSQEPVNPGRLWDSGANLAPRRSDRVNQLLVEREDIACVYGEIESPDPTVKLTGKQPIEQHWKVVRAVVPLRR